MIDQANWVTLPIDVIRFELRRSLTPGRIAMWLLMIAFPVALMAAISMIINRSVGPDFNRADLIEPMGLTLYFLVPEVTCLLGLLLWATPAVSTEIEGQTWVYLTMRQAGRRMVLFGKYLTSILWTCSAALVSILLSTSFIGMTATGSPIQPKLLTVMVSLAFLSCVAHAALYLLIGVIFHRRTMVAAVFYTMAVEYGVSFVPAVINKFTINYRLRGLLADWMDWQTARSQAENIFGSEPAWVHLAAMAAATITLLAVSLYQVERREYPTQQDG